MNALNFLHREFFGNTLENYLWFMMVIVMGILLRQWISGRINRILFRIFREHGRVAGLQKFIQLMSPPMELFVSLVLIYIAFSFLVFPDEWHLASENEVGLRMILSRFFKVLMSVSAFWLLLRGIDFTGTVMAIRAKKTESAADDQLVPFVREAVKVVVVVIGVFVLLGVAFQLDVVSLVAGLGIGGLAIALAAKETLENLLGSFTIFLDKPFVTGDSVKVGNVEGTVESVGFRSTRIRALDKMMVTVPNKKMVDAELINETNRSLRRASFTLLLSYETNENVMGVMLEEIRALLNAKQLIEPGTSTVRFREFRDNGLEIVISFFVMTPEMSIFLMVREEVNFAIITTIRKHNISFSTPLTNTMAVSLPESKK